MYVTKEKIELIEHKFGTPSVITLAQEIGLDEMSMLLGSQKNGRAHDITFFIFNDERQVALIRKPFHPPGVYRAPSGGLEPGEDFESGALREAWEETGLSIRLEKYLLRVHVIFTGGGHHVPWISHVFTASRVEGTLSPVDTHEIAEARYGTLEELQGPIRNSLLATGKGLLRYRVSLTDHVVRMLGGMLK
ncbi:hypothetical protein SY88_21710 [Clostridiales bacterium PH28_bin88]|nr:hypothetical protein SY88_21710 [Clostridiales bacterium PH28_bin88]